MNKSNLRVVWTAMFLGGISAPIITFVFFGIIHWMQGLMPGFAVLLFLTTFIKRK
jgi:hypothetical protein